MRLYKWQLFDNAKRAKEGRNKDFARSPPRTERLCDTYNFWPVRFEKPGRGFLMIGMAFFFFFFSRSARAFTGHRHRPVCQITLYRSPAWGVSRASQGRLRLEYIRHLIQRSVPAQAVHDNDMACRGTSAYLLCVSAIRFYFNGSLVFRVVPT